MKENIKAYNEEGTLDGLYCVKSEDETGEVVWLVYWQEHGAKYDIESFKTEEDARKCVDQRRLCNK